MGVCGNPVEFTGCSVWIAPPRIEEKVEFYSQTGHDLKSNLVMIWQRLDDLSDDVVKVDRTTARTRVVLSSRCAIHG